MLDTSALVTGYIPEVIKTSPRSVAENFLKGVWYSCGHINKSGLVSYFTTTSVWFANEVMQLMLMLGDCPLIRRVGESKNNHQEYFKVGKLSRHRSSPCRYQGPVNDNRVPDQEISRQDVECYGKVFFVRVDSVVPGLPEKVYSVITGGDHSFIANGLVCATV
jgi:intein/homing endonuclease